MQVIRKQTQTRRGKRVVGVAMRLMTGLVAQQKTRIARAVALQGKEFRIPPPAQINIKYISVDRSCRGESGYVGLIWRKRFLQKL